MQPGGSESRYTVAAVSKALDVLACFRAAETLTLAELAQRAGQNKSSVFRLLCTLESHGFVQRTPAGAYQLGLELVHLAYHALNRTDLRQVAAPFMDTLWQAFGDTVNLGALQGNEILYINMIESRYPFRMTATIGSTVPLHSAALGKAIAAHLPSEQLDVILRRDGMPAYTVNTITTWEQLEAELARVRAQGYAIDEEEVELGARCVAVPIFGASGRVIGGLSVSGPTSRIEGRTLQEVCAALAGAGRDISRWLGLTG